MRSLLRSKKGVETAPFFMIFAAFVLVMTATIVFPAMTEWEKIMDKGKATKETIKLKETIDEIHIMADVGSVEVVELAIPPDYQINIESSKLTLTGNNEVVEFPVEGVELNYAGSTLTGKMTVTVAFWKKTGSTTPQGTNLLMVYK